MLLILKSLSCLYIVRLVITEYRHTLGTGLVRDPFAIHYKMVFYCTINTEITIYIKVVLGKTVLSFRTVSQLEFELNLQPFE